MGELGPAIGDWGVNVRFRIEGVAPGPAPAAASVMSSPGSRSPALSVIGGGDGRDIVARCAPAKGHKPWEKLGSVQGCSLERSDKQRAANPLIPVPEADAGIQAGAAALVYIGIAFRQVCSADVLIRWQPRKVETRSYPAVVVERGWGANVEKR
jgi:hypothetical protein